MIDFTEKKINSTEVLVIEGKVYGISLKIINVYFDVRKDDTGRNNNKNIRKVAEKDIK